MPKVFLRLMDFKGLRQRQCFLSACQTHKTDCLNFNDFRNMYVTSTCTTTSHDKALYYYLSRVNAFYRYSFFIEGHSYGPGINYLLLL